MTQITCSWTYVTTHFKQRKTGANGGPKWRQIWTSLKTYKKIVFYPNRKIFSQRFIEWSVELDERNCFFWHYGHFKCISIHFELTEEGGHQWNWSYIGLSACVLPHAIQIITKCSFLVFLGTGYRESRYLWVIDLVWGQDGWILAKFFFACLWTEKESRSIKSQKRNEANIQPSWSNKLSQ